MTNDQNPTRAGASGRIPRDAPGVEHPAVRAAGADDAALDRFWLGVYARLERGIAWVLVSVSLTVLAGFGAYHFATEFLADAAVPAVLRFGTAGLLLGVSILLLGVVRDKIRALTTDPFRRIRR